MYYLIFLGPCECDDINQRRISISELGSTSLFATRKEAVEKCYSWMVSIFSQYGEGYGPETIDELQIIDVSIKSFHVVLYNKQQILEITPIDPFKRETNIPISRRMWRFEQPEQPNLDSQIIGHSVSGGLRLAMVSLLVEEKILSDNTKVVFEHEILKNVEIKNVIKADGEEAGGEEAGGEEAGGESDNDNPNETDDPNEIKDRVVIDDPNEEDEN